jgi:branched-chain amino acid transport system ATP-binding protein
MLRLSGVTVHLGGLPVLRALTMELPKGAVVGLVGHNGAGKTTTLKTIVGLVSPDSGEIRFDELNLGAIPCHKRVRSLGIGYLPEDRGLISQLTVEENLLLPLWAQAIRDSAEPLQFIYWLLPEVRGLASRRASQLSGGQQKLVALARSFMTARNLLLLDEPMEGVSPALSAKLATATLEFQRQSGATVLAAESDLNRMKLLTERIYTIERGQVV